MERSEEQQKHILLALEERDIRTVRNVGQALHLHSPTSLKREELLEQIAVKLREGRQDADGKPPRPGRPSLGGVEGVEILKRLDEEYYQSKAAPLRTLAGAHNAYDIPSVPLGTAGKAWADTILRGQRVLLYSIDPSSVRGALSVMTGFAAKSDIKSLSVVCDVAPEQSWEIAAAIGGDVVSTNFGMTSSMQCDRIVAQIRAFLEHREHSLLMVEDAGSFAEVTASGDLSSDDAVRILCGLAVARDEGGTVTLICGTNDDAFVKKYSRMFNHVVKV